MTSSPAATERVIGVGVPVPGLGLLSYRASAGCVLHKGARVRVPVGRRALVGCVADLAAVAPPGAALREVIDVLDDSPFVPPAVVDLALWVGEYYLAGPGAALVLAMPVASRDRHDAFRRRRVVALTAGADPALTRGPRQRAAIQRLAAAPQGVPAAELAREGIGAGVVSALVARGLAIVRDDVSLRDPFAVMGGVPRWSIDRAAASEPVLTVEQADVFRRLEEAAALRTFRTVLLQGVTGSGKTELYLQLARLVVAGGRRVLVLTPEIALTPGLAGQFRARFGERVAIQHSGLAPGERHDQWHEIRRGRADIVVGTRSAVFAPIENLGLIIVDEEHDGSYKQDESPRYHGRDVAIVRGRLEGALVVLGSATPSLESAANVAEGRYDIVHLRRRVLDRPLATVRVVNMREEYAAHGPEVALSGLLLEAMAARLGRGEQCLVLLNRRGFATVVFCRQCGASLECPHCSVSLTYHRLQRRVRCHYCNYAVPLPRRCGACGGDYLEQTGLGTERLEAEVRAQFPAARVARIDRDTVRRRGAIARILTAVDRGELDVVVGTQMIAKGHDFPAVTLVGVVSADVGLGLADFRAAERTFQLLTQVVGRAGRGNAPGEAVIQTLYPDHYAVTAAAAQDYATFFAREMQFRTALRYPPAVALINVVVRSRSPERAMADAHDLAVRTRRHHPHGPVVGPAPAAIARIRDEHRAQFFIKGQKRRAMREALARALDERPDLRRRVVIDVDPMSVL